METKKKYQLLQSAIGFISFLIAFNSYAGCPITIKTGSTQVTCLGGANGTATVTVSGATGTFSYSWSNGQASLTSSLTNQLSNLTSAVYTVTVTDQTAGCTLTASVIVAQPGPVITSTAEQSVSCNGGTDGKAWVTANGFKPAYTYAWNPSLSINDTIFSLSAGSYTVTVTDNSSCTASSVIIVPQPPVLTGTVSGKNSSCNGTLDGSVTIIPAGGTPAYTYSWNTAPPQTTATAANIGPGTYTIKLSDSKGCEFFTNEAITESPPLFINTPVYTTETCQLGNGKISVSLVGGNLPYTYAWSPPANTQTTATATNLHAGTYTVTVTDSKGCTSSKTAVLSNQYIPPVLTGTQNNISCFGSANGKAAVTITSGSAPYSYSWSPSAGTGPTATNLTPAIYTVTVTDINTCTSTWTATLTQPLLLGQTTTSTPTSCGLNNGTANLSASGGTPPYSYSWSNGGTGMTATGLNAGTYTVTLTDANLCKLTTTVVLSSSNPVTIHTVQTNPLCNGNTDGTATVSATGGISGTWDYLWSPGGATSSAITGLSASAYTVTVTDALHAGCLATSIITITQPALLNPQAAAVNVTCAGLNNGQASSSPSGGTSPYTYSWNTGSTGTGSGSTINNLAPGTYTLTVTDANACTLSVAEVVHPGIPITASINSLININCFGSADGSVSVNASGGTGTLTYSWSSGIKNATAAGLSPGTYTVSVTDANACQVTSTAVLTQPALLSLTPSSTQPTCGNQDGTATITPSGGLAPYSYTWSPLGGGTGNLSSHVSQLTSGSYTVTVSDANSCTQTQALALVPADPILLTPSQVNLTCAGPANGQASVSASGGTGTYSYSWSALGGGTGDHTNNTTLLAANSYTVTVTDAANAACLATTAITITQPNILAVSATPSGILCFGQTNGAITATTTGGTPAYTYSWSPLGAGAGQLTSTVSGLSSGTYTITVTDAHSCTGTNSANIIEPPILNLNLTTTNAACAGNKNGSVQATITGGTPAYTYSCSNGTNAISNSLIHTFTNLPSGTYTLTVTDANGCQIVSTTTITEPPGFSIAVAGTNPACYGNNGSALVSPAGGSGSFGFLWTPGAETGSSISGLDPGNYSVKVTDLTSGCDTTGSITLAWPVIKLQFDSVNLSCNGSSNGKVWVTASGATSPYSYSWNLPASTNDTLKSLNIGTYSVTVSDNAGCQNTGSVSVTQPSALSLILNSTSASCYGGTNGTVSLTASGGIPPYAYSWSSGPTSGSIPTSLLHQFNNLSAAAYTVSVTDANICPISGTVTITQPAQLQLKADSISVSCQGGKDGSAIAMAAGGTSPYTYSCSNGTTVTSSSLTHQFNNLPAATYTITLNDANACSTTTLIPVTEPGVIVLVTAEGNPGCGLNSGKASVSATGGNGTYAYQWAPVSGSKDTLLNLTAGEYTVTVTDQKGCSAIDSAQLIPLNPIQSTGSMTNCTCYGSNDGKAGVSATGGSGTYLYAWSTTVGNTGPSLSNLIAGSYTVTISDQTNSSCKLTDTLVVTQPISVLASLASSPATCFGDATGTVLVTASIGLSPYTYSWNTGSTAITNSTSNQITNLAAGSYTVSISNSNGCKAIDSIKVTQPPALSTTTSAKNASCGNTYGKVIVSATGGTGSYSYSWTPMPSSTDSLTNLLPGSYTVVVLDANNCLKKDSATVLLNNSISIKLTETGTSCFGHADGKITTNASGGSGSFAYLWSPGGSTAPNLLNLGVGMYTVTVTEGTINGCSKIDSIQVTQPALLDANLVITKTSCLGTSNFVVTANPIGGTPGYAYTWSFGGTAQSEGNLSPGTYVLALSDTNGCDTAKIFSVNSAPTPFLLAPAITDPKCNLSNGAITVDVFGGSPAYTYNWSTGASAITGSVSIRLPALPAGIYTLTVTDAFTCTDTRTITLTNIVLPPVLTMDSESVSCYGFNTGKATVAVSAGSPPFAYSWSPSGGTNTVTTGLQAGVYTVTVKDGQSCTSTSSVTITQPPPLQTRITKTNPLCFGYATGSAILSVSGGTGPDYTYSWSAGANSITSSLNYTYTNLIAGLYSVLVTDSNACTILDTVTIQTPSALLPHAAQINVLCFGKNTGSAMLKPSGATPAYSYTWNTGADTNVISNLPAGNYIYIITDAFGCYVKDTIKLLQADSIILKTAGIETKCFASCDGEAVAIPSMGISPYTFSWSEGGSGPAIQHLCQGMYTIQITDSNGCQALANVTVNQPSPFISKGTSTPGRCSLPGGTVSVNVSGATAPYSYLWAPSGQTGSQADSMLTGTYTVYITDANSCKDTALVNLKNPDLVSVITTGDTIICIGQTAQIHASASGGTPAYTYSWNSGAFIGPNYNVSPLLSANYNIVVSDSNNCLSHPVIHTVNVRPPLKLNSIPAPAPVCSGVPTILTAVATGGNGNYFFTWSPGGITGPVLTATPSVTSPYTIVVEDGCGTPADTANVILTIYPNPVTQFVSADTGSCQNICVPFTDQSTVLAGSVLNAWIWDFGNGHKSNLQNPLECYPDSGRFTVSLKTTTDKGCTSTLAKAYYIDIYSLPSAGFTMDPVKPEILNPVVRFQDKSRGALSWDWNFGDGSAPGPENLTENTKHTYADTGNYCIWQLVTNSHGCKDSVKNCLTVVPEFTYFIPNTFTPNGDGKNEVFNGKGTYLKTYRMLIFDRWGNMVFFSNDPEMGWDGTIATGSGQTAPQGEYVYKVDLTDFYDQKHSYNGTLTLIR